MGLNLSENIRKNRRESNLSQEAFAERLGVSFQTISKWERGECYPDIEMLPKIANFFGITIDALMGADQCQEKEYVNTLQEEFRLQEDYYPQIRELRGTLRDWKCLRLCSRLRHFPTLS